MVIINHTMILVRSKIKSVESQEDFFLQNKKKLTFFYIIETKPVDIVFKKTIDNMKEVNKNYVIP